MKSYYKQPIYKSKDYLNYIRSMDCVACDHTPFAITVHHESLGLKAMGKNLIPDSYTIPLCVRCHGIRHDIGYRTFWKKINLDPKLIIINNITGYLRAA